MFLQLAQPPSLTADGLFGIRFSLNTPILEAGPLPSGAARAVIVLHQEESDRRVMTVGVRSLGTSEVTLFRFQRHLETEADYVQATEAALTFCEGMGFVFDDDELERSGPEGRAEALIRWREFAEPPREDGSESLPAPRAERPVAPGATAPPRPDPSSLSKFRSREAVAAPGERGRKAAGAALGRIPLLKRRRSAAGDRLSFLLRILGGF